LALATTVAIPLAACAQSQLPLSDQQIDEIESRRDHFRIVGEVEFDGERIAYDEIIQIRTDVGFNVDLGEVSGDIRTGYSRVRIARLVKSGGVLMMEVPSAGGLWTDLEGHATPQAHWTDEYIERYMRPPREFLPEFYWFDDARHPKRAEAYISESYYDQPIARLKIIQPIRLEFVPRSPQAEATAIAQIESEPSFEYFEGRTAYGPGWWQTIFLLPLDRGEWSQIAEVASAVAEHDSEVVKFNPATSKALHDYARTALLWGDRRRTSFGVPQPRKYGDDPFHPDGILYERRRSLKRA
jgi:hypothetical protein